MYSLPENDGNNGRHQQKDHRARDDQGRALQGWIRVVRRVRNLQRKKSLIRNSPIINKSSVTQKKV